MSTRPLRVIQVTEPPADLAAVAERLERLCELLAELLARPASAPPSSAAPSAYLSAREVAALLGASERSVRTWGATGVIPAPVRIGRRRVWSRRAIEEHLARATSR